MLCTLTTRYNSDSFFDHDGLLAVQDSELQKTAAKH